MHQTPCSVIHPAGHPGLATSTPALALQRPVGLAGQPLNALLLPIVQILVGPQPLYALLANRMSLQQQGLREKPNLILLAPVHLPRVLPHIELLVPAQLLDLAVVLLVADGCGGREDEGAGDDYGQEGEAEEEEGPLRDGGAVTGAGRVEVRLGVELVGGEDRHFRGQSVPAWKPREEKELRLQ